MNFQKLVFVIEGFEIDEARFFFFLFYNLNRLKLISFYKFNIQSCRFFAIYKKKTSNLKKFIN